jgi:alpha-tubulin suppressor-like RCC1 family protein
MMSQSPSLVDSVLDFNFRKVCCGSNHTALLEENGIVITFGRNNLGQVGVKNSFDEENQR